ncbi:MAG TPA: diphosphomevalonate decarboxylase [Thermoplasmata archaeon]|nr:diphosphomevalonate decarboxylase [Thermoplasmata archaeon]
MARARPGAATFEAPPNIALVKYWGVRDRALALPYNSSISVSLDRLRSRTRVAFEPSLEADEVEINGRPAGGGPREAVVKFLDRVRSLAGTSAHAVVSSENNFPTASGLASSASGFAALAGAATRAAGLTLSDRSLGRLARFGSGSASRSIFGGFVEWRAGARADGQDCYARSLFGPTHWPELRDVVVLVRGAPTKAVRSQDAMQATVATSPYFGERQRELPGRIARIRSAIGARDAERLFPLVMQECDSFRWVCETTRPSLDYLTATSRAVLARVQDENRAAGRPIGAYTHDAGAHVHVFTLRRHVDRLRRSFGEVPGVERTLELRAGPGARRVGDDRALRARGGRSRARGARARSSG